MNLATSKGVEFLAKCEMDYLGDDRLNYETLFIPEEPFEVAARKTWVDKFKTMSKDQLNKQYDKEETKLFDLKFNHTLSLNEYKDLLDEYNQELFEKF